MLAIEPAFAEAMEFAVAERSLVAVAIRPCDSAGAVPLIALPGAMIHASFALKTTDAMPTPLFPGAAIAIAIWPKHFAFAFELTCDKVADEDLGIRPAQCTFAKERVVA